MKSLVTLHLGILFGSIPNYYSQVVNLCQYDMQWQLIFSSLIGDGEFDQKQVDIRMSSWS